MKVLILGDGLLGMEIHKQTGWDQVSRKLGNLPRLEDWGKICTLIKNHDVIINSL